MNTLMLARLQFAFTTLYHFLFVPLSIGLAVLLALMETAYVRTGDELYKRMTLFWGRLFLISFAMGVATGIVLEFQFGMNWPGYARFVGDVFGAPLAVEALAAFFLESTFLGVWIFGWERLSKRAHAAVLWLVVLGSNLSAFWIIAANAWMQHPVGYVLRNGRAELTSFCALVLNPHLPLQFGHVTFASVATGSFFVLSLSAWQLWRGRAEHRELFRRSFRFAAFGALVGSLGVAGLGHAQGQWLARSQPMKLAAIEALWRTENPAGLSLAAAINELGQTNTWSLRVPVALSLLAYNRTDGAVPGIRDLQADSVQKYGPGDYIPPVRLTFWSFRAMVGAGGLMLLLALLAVWAGRGGRVPALSPWRWRALVAAVSLPFIANATGWIVTEVGRQPWVVYGVMKTADGVSRVTPPGAVLASLLVYTLLYGVLLAVAVYLLRTFAVRGPVDQEIQNSNIERRNNIRI